MYDLISIGSVVKDIIVLTDRGKIFKTLRDKLAPKWIGFELGEKIRVDETLQSLGGVAADISIGLRRLGFSAIPYSTIGNDPDGQWIAKELRREKIAITGVIFGKNRQTPLNIIIVDKKSGDRVIFSQKSSGEIDLSRLNKFRAKFLYVSSLKGKTRKQTDIIIKYVKKNNVELIVSPSTSQIRDDFEDLKKLLSIAKILFLNKNEALEVASKAKNKSTDIKNLFELLREFGPKVICITDGTKGAWASDGKNMLHSPIKKVKTVDCTGAGDAFASGFLGFYLKGKSLRDSLIAGITNSANVVQYVGTTKGLMTKKEIMKYL